jgi:hypothetical protein
MDFLSYPEIKADDYLYKHIKSAIQEMSLPLFGDGLTAECLFEFADYFFPALGLDNSPNLLDVVDIQDRIKNKFADWFLPVVRQVGLGGVSITNLRQLQSYGLSLIQSNQYVPVTNYSEVDKRAQSYILQSNFVKRVMSACDYQISKGHTVIERPYPAIMWPDASETDLQQKLRVIYEQSFSEYRSFVGGNGFKSLKSNSVLNDSMAFIYFFDLSSFATTCEIPMRQFVIESPVPVLPKSQVIFTNELPKCELTITINGNLYNAQSAMESHAKDVLSPVAIRQKIYKMFESDSKDSYEPKYQGNTGFKPHLVL